MPCKVFFETSYEQITTKISLFFLVFIWIILFAIAAGLAVTLLAVSPPHKVHTYPIYIDVVFCRETHISASQILTIPPFVFGQFKISFRLEISNLL